MTQKKSKNDEKVQELTADLQRVRADFENYHKRVELEKQQAGELGEAKAIKRLLPIVDTIERAAAHMPAELADNAWAQGVAGLAKQLEKALDDIGLRRINAASGTPFDPSQHQAIQFDEDAVGEHEIIAEELQAGYIYKGSTLRDAMVKVTRK